jgi:hypothetical protein
LLDTQASVGSADVRCKTTVHGLREQQQGFRDRGDDR